MDKKFILGHRGYSQIAPENTELAFDCAHLFGFDGVELDVHLTKDCQLVIIHDETVDRTSSHFGYIKDHTLAELNQYDFSSKFKVSGLPFQKLLTLKQFLKKYGNIFKIINIEIKTDIIQYDKIEEKINQTIQKVGKLSAQIILSSFHFPSLEKIHNLNPELKLGFLFWTNAQFDKISSEKIKAVCTFLHPWWKIYQVDKWKSKYDQLNLKYNLWTFDSEKIYQKFSNDPNVYSLISNRKF